MRKYLLSVFVLFCFIFIGINDVKAADNCTCYYNGRLQDSDSQGRNETHYLVSISFNKQNYNSSGDKEKFQPNISFFGEKMYHPDTEESGKIEDETSLATWFTRYFQGGAGVSSSQVESLFDTDCDCNAVGTLTFISSAGSKELYYNIDDYYYMLPSDLPVLGYNRLDLTSMTYEQFQEQLESDNVGNTSSGQGFAGIQGIVNWGNLISGTGYYNIDDVGKGCSTVTPIATYLSQIFWLICVVSIIFLVVMTAIDFIKAIVGSEEDKLLKAFKNFKTRIIVVIILILLPAIVSFAINIYNQNADNSNGVVEIGEDGKPFCNAIGEGNN